MGPAFIITNHPKEKGVENFRKKVKLVAAKNAVERFSPKKEEAAKN